jgi:hypothetical protein
MLGIPLIRPISCAVIASVALAGAHIIWMFGSIIVAGRELSAAEEIALDLSIGAVLLFTLAWLALRHRWRG